MSCKSAWDVIGYRLWCWANLLHAFVRSETAEAIDFVLYYQARSHRQTP